MTPQTLTVIQLTARGPDNQELKTELVEGTVIRIGRSPASGWAIPWDRLISREHADVQWKNGQLTVACTANAANPIIWRGQPQREIVASSGEVFRIGATEFQQSTYEVAADSSDAAKETEMMFFEGDESVEEYTYAANELRMVKFSDPSRQMELLANLPEMISSSTSDVELAVKVVGVLLEAIPQAVAAAVVQYDPSVVLELRRSTTEKVDLSRPHLIRAQTRDDYEGRFFPSRQLLLRALKQNESMIHIWSEGAGGAEFTISDNLDWAFCTPIDSESCIGWCLYVAGEGAKDDKLFISEEDLEGDLRFTQLLSKFIGSIRHVRRLEDQKTQLSLFFSPKVIQSLSGRAEMDLMKPSERDITVMFCDVRGFSKKEEMCGDDLHQLLNSAEAALDAMTGAILEHDGTIADFQGDKALGFWGWPVALEEGPVPACLAALSVCAEFNRQPEDQGRLEGFSVGIGIAHGRAIAGQIGTRQQAKIGVFGPVVNQGSRLEGVTRQFGVAVCVDEATADFVRRVVPNDKARVRKLARIRPKGMDTVMTISELLPPAGPTCSITDAVIERHEAAVNAITSGEWTTAYAILEALPSSGPKKFLLDHMAEFGGRPPTEWTGSFALVAK